MISIGIRGYYIVVNPFDKYIRFKLDYFAPH